MSILRTEDISIDHGDGVLDVRGDDFDTALLIAGCIAAYQWCDCQGSVGQHLIRTTSPNPAPAVESFRRAVTSTVPADVTLAARFSELIALLVDGKYRLQIEDMPSDSYVVEWELPDGPPIEHTNYYGGFRSLVATQPNSALSSATVQEYVSTIETGARPLVITLSAGEALAEFILDGHHKAEAYRKAAVPIRTFSIYRLDSEEVDLADALAFVPEEGGLRKHLRKHKRASRS